MNVAYNHLHFRSEDPDAAAKFYCDNFGAKITSERPLSTTKSIQLELNGHHLMTISGRAEGENPVPHYWAHVHWAFGAEGQEDFLQKSDGMNLNGHMDRITVPFLVTHGANDRQISPSYADDLYDQLVNSPRREKVIFTAREGGVEHVGADNMAYGRDLLSDWFAETLGGETR